MKNEKKKQTLSLIYNQATSFKVEPITLSVNPLANITGQAIVNDTFYKSAKIDPKMRTENANIKISQSDANQ